MMRDTRFIARAEAQRALMPLHAQRETEVPAGAVQSLRAIGGARCRENIGQIVGQRRHRALEIDRSANAQARGWRHCEGGLDVVGAKPGLASGVGRPTAIGIVGFKAVGRGDRQPHGHRLANRVGDRARGQITLVDRIVGIGTAERNEVRPGINDRRAVIVHIAVRQDGGKTDGGIAPLQAANRRRIPPQRRRARIGHFS